MAKSFGANMNLPLEKGDRKLVWGDCFNGNDYNKELWNPINMWKVSDIDQKLCEDTYRVENGQLILTSSKLPADKQVDGKAYVTPCFFTTKDRMEFKYGYFEIKAQIPFYKGNSGAFWFFTSEETKKGYKCEVDLVEQLGHDNAVESAIHAWGTTHTSCGRIPRKDRSHTFASTPEELRLETHTYFIDWTPEYIDFGLDNEVYFHFPLTEDCKQYFEQDFDLECLHLPLFFILSEYLYTPGRKLSWGMDGTEEPFEYVMKVDHVALYQKEGEEIYLK